ncbi:MAG: hypothetical protein FWF71_07915 [Actinomycetia bacterium]|nr:hypothetical protein [Actinomycetes bacterium]
MVVRIPPSDDEGRSLTAGREGGKGSSFSPPPAPVRPPAKPSAPPSKRRASPSSKEMEALIDEFLNSESKADSSLDTAIETGSSLPVGKESDATAILQKAVAENGNKAPDSPPVYDFDLADVEITAEASLAALAEESQKERSPIWPLLITAAAVFIVLTGSLSIYLRVLQAQTEAMRSVLAGQAYSVLTDAIACIQEADVVVVALDKTMDTQVTLDSLPDLQALLGQVEGAQDVLDQAVEKASKAERDFAEPENRQVAKDAVDAASSRKQLLDLSVQLTNADISAMQCAGQLDIAWAALVSADTAMRQAVSEVNNAGPAQLPHALELNQGALQKLQEAKDALTLAAQSFQTADFGSLMDYTNARIDSCQLAIASNQAALAQDNDTANQKNQEFLAKDAEAVEMAKKVPDDPRSIIVDAYDGLTTPWRNAYRELRSNTADIDVRLRAWIEQNPGEPQSLSG